MSCLLRVSGIFRSVYFWFERFDISLQSVLNSILDLEFKFGRVVASYAVTILAIGPLSEAFAIQFQAFRVFAVALLKLEIFVGVHM